MKKYLATVLVCSLCANCAFGAMTRELTERLLRSTYKIEADGIAGSAFVVLAPILTRSNEHAFVLITAAHVLEGIRNPKAKLWIRSYNGTHFTKEPFELELRTNNVPTWVRHPVADVAVMRIPFVATADIVFVNIHQLANDEFLRDYQVSPGDELRVIGYPLSFEGLSGFGILRTGRIASFPLTPSKETKTFLLDFPVFQGNSGGPVFMAETRHMIDGKAESVNLFKILGLVSLELSQSEAVASMSETTIRKHKLGLAVIVHAEMIRETIKLLPIE